MAALAGHRLVPPGQREARAAVIEAAAVDLRPARGGVARRALRAQPPRVRIAVAARAGRERRALEPLRLARPPAPGDSFAQATLLVPSGERKRRLVVIERRRRLPLVRRMTVRASPRRELTAVGIRVARRAARAQAEERAREVGPAAGDGGLVLDLASAVARLAGQARVAPLEREPGQRVVEGGLALLAPEHELEGAALVLDVAALAGAVVAARVKSLSRRDALAESGVAGEATPGGDALAGLVARAAVARPFERLVEAAQVAGRELRPGLRRLGESEQDREEEDALHGQPNP